MRIKSLSSLVSRDQEHCHSPLLSPPGGAGAADTGWDCQSQVGHPFIECRCVMCNILHTHIYIIQSHTTYVSLGHERGQ